MLKRLEIPVIWHHFGDGVLEKELLHKANQELPQNVKFVYHGRVQNKEVIHEFLKTKANVFLHLSETEGLPVSFMQSLSCGIPIICCNVGGVSEIVNEQNGFLLDKGFDLNHVRFYLKEMNAKRTTFDPISLKQNAKKMFDKNINYKSFLEWK